MSLIRPPSWPLLLLQQLEFKVQFGLRHFEMLDISSSYFFC